MGICFSHSRGNYFNSKIWWRNAALAVFSVSVKVFWALRSRLQQLVEWAIWCKFGCLSILVHGKCSMQLELVWQSRIYICSPYSPCGHLQKRHKHMAAPPHHCGQTICLWSSCLRCAWSSQNLHLGDLILFLKVFRALFDFKKNAHDFV